MPKNPLGMIKDVADAAVTTAVGTGQKVAGQVVGTAVTAVGAVASKVPGRDKPSRADGARTDAECGPAGGRGQDAR